MESYKRCLNPFHASAALILATLIAIFPLNAFAQDTPAAKAPESTAAVWDLTNLSKSTLSDETIGALTQYVRVKVFNFMPNYRWLDRGNIKEVIDEQKFQASGCTDQSCVVELGQLLGARKMVTGSVSKTGSTYNLTLSVIDIETGLIDKSVSEICPDCTESQLYQLAEKAVLAMSGKPSQKLTEPEPDYAGAPVHQRRINFSLNYPGAGLRYFFSDKTCGPGTGMVGGPIRGPEAAVKKAVGRPAGRIGEGILVDSGDIIHNYSNRYCVPAFIIIPKKRATAGRGKSRGKTRGDYGSSVGRGWGGQYIKPAKLKNKESLYWGGME